ncbi:MAG: ABC transporter substrate-binding protein [Candidatus Lokiarchaeota archaeon]|nr:ABC transporter substrate-binding protein [Candidatus Lokiarchaeota archaeon]
MESLTKRILAIVLIAVIGVGIGVGAWIFLGAPPVKRFSTPGAPSGVASDHIIKIGVAGDTGEITGDGAYKGVHLAIKEINEAGGIDINGSDYYFGYVMEDTDEGNPNLVTSRGVAAAERLVYDRGIQFAIGGFRTEAVLAYQEVFMDNQIIFMSVGVATDIFTDNVRNFYDRYKYFFRAMPNNSTSLGGQIFSYLSWQIAVLNYQYGATHNITKVGILSEDLTWTISTENFLNDYLPYAGVSVPTGASIRYDITLSAADMNTHMQTFEDLGCDLVIPVISAQGGIMMMQNYADSERPYIIIGIDVQSQLDTFWDQSNGACAYETVMQGCYRVNKTPTTIAFWDDFHDLWGHDPLYTAQGAYDATRAISWAIDGTNSLDADTLIDKLETRTPAAVLATPSAFPGSVTGLGAIWPDDHELPSGYPFGYTLWVQWNSTGGKEVVPTAGHLYPDGSVVPMGTYSMAPWVHTLWST